MKKQATPAKRKRKTTIKRKNSRSGHEVIAHTADIGLRCYGHTAKELFEQAAIGMFSIIGTLRPGAEVLARDITEQRVVVLAGDQEELLIGWLSELLGLSDSRDLMCRDVSITELSATRVTASVQLIPKTEQFYEFHNEIKAVTYHDVSIRECEGLLRAEVLFDV